MKSTLILLFFSLSLLSCQEPSPKNQESPSAQVEQKAVDFFATFAERADWDKFCSFYREDLVFEDIILQIRLDSLWKFKRFYKWDEEGDRFKKLSPEQEHLSLHSLVVNDRIAVARGRVNPFYYDGVRVETEWGMEFSIWLYFDEDLKIMKQVDWFEYDPNTLSSIVKRCEEKGFEAIPQWLDLSKKE